MVAPTGIATTNLKVPSTLDDNTSLTRLRITKMKAKKHYENSKKNHWQVVTTVARKCITEWVEAPNKTLAERIAIIRIGELHGLDNPEDITVVASRKFF